MKIFRLLNNDRFKYILYIFIMFLYYVYYEYEFWGKFKNRGEKKFLEVVINRFGMKYYIVVGSGKVGWGFKYWIMKEIWRRLDFEKY